MKWDRSVLDALDRMSIYRRERLRQRIVTFAEREKRERVTAADLEAVRRQGMDRTTVEPLAPTAWPALPGSYTIIDPDASVAICTLASEWLSDSLARLPGVAIIGRALTENLGTEKVALNVISNPAIRVLVLCGTESRHAVGDTLRQLHREGLDPSGRVIGASSPMPVLRNFPPEAQQMFHEQVALVDLVDETDTDRIASAVVDAAAAAALEPFGEAWHPSVSLASPAASEGEEWEEDPAGFVLITLGPARDRIIAELYSREAELRSLVQARTAEELTRTVLARGGASSLTHAAYVGREATRAEMALRLGLPYEQDRQLTLPGAVADGGQRAR